MKITETLIFVSEGKVNSSCITDGFDKLFGFSITKKHLFPSAGYASEKNPCVFEGSERTTSNAFQERAFAQFAFFDDCGS